MSDAPTGEGMEIDDELRGFINSSFDQGLFQSQIVDKLVVGWDLEQAGAEAVVQQVNDDMQTAIREKQSASYGEPMDEFDRATQQAIKDERSAAMRWVLIFGVAAGMIIFTIVTGVVLLPCIR